MLLAAMQESSHAIVKSSMCSQYLDTRVVQNARCTFGLEISNYMNQPIVKRYWNRMYRRFMV